MGKTTRTHNSRDSGRELVSRERMDSRRRLSKYYRGGEQHKYYGDRLVMNGGLSDGMNGGCVGGKWGKEWGSPPLQHVARRAYTLNHSLPPPSFTLALYLSISYPYHLDFTLKTY
jgi:hypothetical protein